MLSDFQNLVSRLVRDDTGKLTADDIDNGIEAAVSRYSKDRPDVVVADITSTGGQVLPLPTGWVPGFSDIQELEYPIGNFDPSTIEWSIYQAPSGEEIRIPVSLEADEQVRATFTVFHTLDATTDTISIDDREAVCCYAAAYCCEQLASLFSGDSDSTIQADSVDHQGGGSRWSSRAKSLRKRYFDELGIEPKRNEAAGVVVDLDMPNSLGHDRLLHTGRYR